MVLVILKICNDQGSNKSNDIYCSVECMEIKTDNTTP